jgi:hypothetical protein
LERRSSNVSNDSNATLRSTAENGMTKDERKYYRLLKTKYSEDGEVRIQRKSSMMIKRQISLSKDKLQHRRSLSLTCGIEDLNLDT